LLLLSSAIQESMGQSQTVGLFIVLAIKLSSSIILSFGLWRKTDRNENRRIHSLLQP